MLTTAVAGTGAGNLVAPDTVCVFWTWGGDGLRSSPTAVVPRRPSCGRARSLDGDARRLRGHGGGVPVVRRRQDHRRRVHLPIGFVRSGTPSEQAFVGMVGTLRCTHPLSDDDCATLTQKVDDAADVSADLDLEAVAGGGG